MIAIPGSALQFMDLEKVRKLGEDKLQGWITRVDLYADFFEDEYTVDRAVKDYQAGLYNSGGRKPSHRYVGPLEASEGSEGRTLYIGRRENGKEGGQRFARYGIQSVADRESTVPGRFPGLVREERIRACRDGGPGLGLGQGNIRHRRRLG
ncbi:MAG: replication initiation factor domain-containing protein [Nitrospinae bacterium]|nr:replication initiation factor domain-containing protein [Nitrospinota bacterium]